MKIIHFGSTEIVELADNGQDFNESKQSVTMSVDDFERRRIMRLKRQEPEIGLFFFLDRMASTVPSRPLMAPHRQMSRESIFAGEEEKNQPLTMPERRAFFDASHTVSSIFVVTHAVSKFLRIARKSTAVQEPDQEPDEERDQEPVQEPVQEPPMRQAKHAISSIFVVTHAVSKFLRIARKSTAVQEPDQESDKEPVQERVQEPPMRQAKHAASSIFVVTHAASKFLRIARKSTAVQEPPMRQAVST
jgi:hypothetical protein